MSISTRFFSHEHEFLFVTLWTWKIDIIRIRRENYFLFFSSFPFFSSLFPSSKSTRKVFSRKNCNLRTFPTSENIHRAYRDVERAVEKEKKAVKFRWKCFIKWMGFESAQKHGKLNKILIFFISTHISFHKNFCPSLF